MQERIENKEIYRTHCLAVQCLCWLKNILVLLSRCKSTSETCCHLRNEGELAFLV
jgi:hypothetical protein